MTKVFKYALICVFTMGVFAFAGCIGTPNTGEVAPHLVGTWIFADYEGVRYVLNDDGTGIRGLQGEEEPITWGVVDDNEFRVRREGSVPSREIRNERWGYTLRDGVLRLESLQVNNMVETFHQLGFVGTPNTALVGRWNWNDEPAWHYELNSDGTGTRGSFTDMVEFLWGTVGNVLHIQLQGNIPADYIRNERWNFNLSGDALTLDAINFDATWSYTRCIGPGEIYANLVGAWVWNNDSTWAYVFHEDGTGTMGSPGEIFVIRWGVVGEQILLFFQGSLVDTMTFQITGNSLITESIHSPGIIYGYTRAGEGDFDDLDFYMNPALFGRWTWDDNTDWAYMFDPDGLGTRGFPGTTITFEWATLDNELWLLLPGDLLEAWEFTITGNSMRLYSLTHDDTWFYYTRD